MITRIICAAVITATTWAAVAVMAWEAWRDGEGFWGTLSDEGVFLTAAIAAYATVAAIALATWG